VRSLRSHYFFRSRLNVKRYVAVWNHQVVPSAGAPIPAPHVRACRRRLVVFKVTENC